MVAFHGPGQQEQPGLRDPAREAGAQLGDSRPDPIRQLRPRAVTLPSPTCAIHGFRDAMVWIPLLWKLKIPPPLCHCQPARATPFPKGLGAG